MAQVLGELLRVHEDDEGRLELAFEAGRGELSLALDGTARLRLWQGEAPPMDLDTALGRTPFELAPARWRTESGRPALMYAGREGAARVEIAARPFALRVCDREGGTVAALGDFAFNEDGGVSATLRSRADEHFFGFGERGGGLDKRGEQIQLRNRDVLMPPRSDARYVSIPFFVGHSAGRAARGILVDAPGPCDFDVAASSDREVRMETRSGGLDLCVFAGPLPADVLDRFTRRAGRQALPPVWALGHHQSRWGYRSAKSVTSVARQLRERRIPTDAIHLDIDYMDGYRVFTWHPKRFPDPKGLMASLRQNGFRTVAIVDPGVKVDPEYPIYQDGRSRGVFCSEGSGREWIQRVWPGQAAMPDFNRPDVRTWWGQQHAGLLDAGVAGIWNDMNEPAGWRRDLRLGRAILPLQSQDATRVMQADPVEAERRGGELATRRQAIPLVSHESVRNLYGQQECRATRDELKRGHPQARPFVLTRSGTTGIQQLAAVWTGDNASRWSHLRESMPMLMGLSLSGVAFCGADIGGFGGHCSPELFARWMQIGALYPFARTHSVWYSRRQEPWRFGSRVESIAREALELRMRLLPYLAGLFRDAHETGAPVWRPLFFEFPETEGLAEVDDQVMIGSSLMAAPVVERGATRREVMLPPGLWWDVSSDACFRGPRRIEVEAPLERLPLFARGGSLVPMQSAVQHTGERPAEPFVLEVYPGADCETVLWDDAGDGTATPARTPLRLHDRAGGRLRLEIGRREGELGVDARPLRVVVHGAGRPDAVFSDGIALAEGDAVDEYRVVEGRVEIRLLDQGDARSLEIDPAP